MRDKEGAGIPGGGMPRVAGKEIGDTRYLQGYQADERFQRERCQTGIPCPIGPVSGSIPRGYEPGRESQENILLKRPVLLETPAEPEG